MEVLKKFQEQKGIKKFSDELKVVYYAAFDRLKCKELKKSTHVNFFLYVASENLPRAWRTLRDNPGRNQGISWENYVELHMQSSTTITESRLQEVVQAKLELWVQSLQ